MGLTPILVQQQQFKNSLRGYSEPEVDEFLDEVVVTLKEHEQNLRDAEERVAVLEEQLRANRDTEEAMRNSFVAAQRAAEDIIAEARIEADRLKAEAGVEATSLSSSHVTEKESLDAELVTLRSTVANLKEELQALAAGMLPAVAETQQHVEEAALHVTSDSGSRNPESELETPESSSPGGEWYDETPSWGVAEETAEIPTASSRYGIIEDDEDLPAPGTARDGGPNYYRPFDHDDEADDVDLDVPTEESTDVLAEQDAMFVTGELPSPFLENGDPHFSDPSSEDFPEADDESEVETDSPVSTAAWGADVGNDGWGSDIASTEATQPAWGEPVAAEVDTEDVEIADAPGVIAFDTADPGFDTADAVDDVVSQVAVSTEVDPVPTQMESHADDDSDGPSAVDEAPMIEVPSEEVVLADEPPSSDIGGDSEEGSVDESVEPEPDAEPKLVRRPWER